MARSRSLAKIHEQIAKLQEEAASLQSTVIARIRREIAQHGLTAEHLFGADDSTFVGNGRRLKTGVQGPKSAKTEKPPKFADSNGNTWHGVGKRPQWIHQALAEGKSLDEFLVSKSATTTSAAKAKKTGNEGPQAIRRRSKTAPAKKATKAAAATKPARRAPAKKAAAAPSPAVKKTAGKRASAKTPASKRGQKVAKAAAPADGASDQAAT